VAKFYEFMYPHIVVYFEFVREQLSSELCFFFSQERAWGRKEQSAVLALVAMVAATAYWVLTRANFASVEQRVAALKGYRLHSELGAGRGGKVYKGKRELRALVIILEY